MYVLNQSNFDFIFPYNGKTYCIPDDNMVHSIRDMDIDFGAYVKIVPKNEVNNYKIGDSIRGTYDTKNSNSNTNTKSSYNDGHNGNYSIDGANIFERLNFASASTLNDFQKYSSTGIETNFNKTIIDKQGDNFMADNARENDLVLAPGRICVCM